MTLTRNYVAIIINVEDKLNKQKAIGDSVIRNLLHMANKILLERNSQGMAVRNENQIVALLSFHSKLSSSNIVAEVKELAKNLQHEIQH